MKTCDHQFFEIRKLRKHTDSDKKYNEKALADWRKKYNEQSEKERLVTIGPWSTPPTIYGYRAKCAKCDLQRDVYENQNGGEVYGTATITSRI